MNRAPIPSRQTDPATLATSSGDVVVTLSSASAGGVPEWIKIAPRGPTTTRTRKPYSFDPEALAARFNADDVKVPIDFDHGIVRLAASGQRADAIGWIEEMAARDDGLYGRVEWLDAGKAALAARTHRYISPSFPHDEQGNATWIHSVALVTAPDLANMPALADARHDASQKPETSMTKTIAAALGLADTADEQACLSAITTLKAGTVSAEVHSQTLATLSTTKDELAELKASIRKGTVDGLLEAALKAKKIVPAQRETFAALCATEDGLKQVTALLAATPEGLGASGLDGKTPEIGAADEVVPATLAAEVTAFQKAQTDAGNPISYLDAFAQVQANKTKKG